MDEQKRIQFDICEKCKSCIHLKKSTRIPPCKGCMETGFVNWEEHEV